jgi:hypothetical protein
MSAFREKESTMNAQPLIQTSLYGAAITRSRPGRRRPPSLRIDLLVSRLMIAFGLIVPAFMVFHFIPASSLFVGIAFGLLVGGGVTALIRCGEVA